MGNNRRSSKGQGKGEVLKEKRPRERSGEGRDELQAQKKQKVELPPVDVTVGFELGEQRRTKTLAELSDDMDRLPAGRFTQPMTMFLLVTELKLVDGEHIGRTEKGDLQETFYVTDGSVTNNYLLSAWAHGSDPRALPNVKPGDVLYGLGIKAVARRDGWNLQWYKDQVRWVKFTGDALTSVKTGAASGPTKKLVVPRSPSQEQARYALALGHAQGRRIIATKASSDSPSTASSKRQSGHADDEPQLDLAQLKLKKSGRQQAELKSVELERYYNLVVEIVDVRPVDDFATEQRVELYVSDYSTNAGFYHRDGSSEAWTGPLGKRSMYLTLWGRAAHQAKTDIEDRRFKPGVLLTLQNVRVKAVTNARVEHDGAMLEAVLHDKTQGTHEKTGERFWYALGGKASKGVQAAFFEPYTKEWFAAEALIRLYWENVHPRLTADVVDEVEETQQARATESKVETSAAKAVMYEGTDLAETATIRQILTAPVTAYERCHVQARIVDYFPSALNEWVHATCAQCGEELPTSLSKCDTHADADVAVRLRFFLALQDDDLAKAPLSDDGRRVLSLKVKVDETDCTALFPGLQLDESARRNEDDALCKRMAPLLGNLALMKRRNDDLSKAKTPMVDLVVRRSVEDVPGKGKRSGWRFGSSMRFVHT